MVALTAASQRRHSKMGELRRAKGGTTAIWGGGMLMPNANGFLNPAADAAGGQGVIGVAAQSYAAQASEGLIPVEYLVGLFEFAATSITQAMEGQTMYVVDDNTFDDLPGTNGIVAGRLFQFISATRGLLLIDGIVPGPAILTADADATYGAPEAALLNEIKASLNRYR